MIHGKMNIVIDGQWGSTGKGKLCGWLARKHDVDCAICDFQPNAGHTVEYDGKRAVFCQLPVSAIVPGCILLMSPGSTINLKRLLQEIEEHGVQNRLGIHPNAAVVSEEALRFEAENLGRISSTLKGAGATLGLKTMRHPSVKLARDYPELKHFLCDTTEKLHQMLDARAMVLAESAQGFDLSINHGYKYPYVTSRDITTGSILSNMGCPPQLMGDVYASLRTYPIRVGNTYGPDGEVTGWSGPFHVDQSEISWSELQRLSGAVVDLTERTTVTNKVRRVFTFSMEQIRRFMVVCRPNTVFLNFANHVDVSCLGKTTWAELPESVKDMTKYLDSFLSKWGCRITLIGTGSREEDMVVV